MASIVYKKSVLYGLSYVIHISSQSRVRYLISSRLISLILYYCIFFNWIALYHLSVHWITSHRIASHRIALYCIALHCIALHCIALHCITLHHIVLHCSAFCTFTAQQHDMLLLCCSWYLKMYTHAHFPHTQNDNALMHREIRDLISFACTIFDSCAGFP